MRANGYTFQHKNSRKLHDIRKFLRVSGNCFMLCGSLISMVWSVLRLQMEETASRYGGQLRMHWISSWQG